MKTVRFRCPHCHTVVEIPSGSLGSVVECPRKECGLAFNATPPSGELVGSMSPSSSGASNIPRADVGIESTLFERHPAMFRKRPLTCIGLWSVLVLGVVGAVAGLAGTTVLGLPAMALAIVCGVLVLAAAGSLISWWIKVIDTTLVITTERSILRTGIFDKRSTEVLHEDVRNLQFNQSFTDRMLGVGDIALSSSGQDDLELVVKGIPNPDEIVETIRRHQADN